MLDVVIIGAGGFAREVYQWMIAALDPQEYKVKGFISNSPNDLDGMNVGVGVLGSDDSYQASPNDRFVMAIGDVDIRRKVLSRYKEKGSKFLSIVHPTAVVAATAKLGDGVIICPYSVVSDHASIGDFAVMNFFSSVAHNATLGFNCVLSPYAAISGNVTVEDDVFVGTHASVAPGRTIGTRSKISANSVAMYDVPAGSLLCGVPGKSRVIFKAK